MVLSSSSPEDSKPPSDRPINHHRFLPKQQVVETCKDWEFGGFVHDKGMGSVSFGDLSGSQVDEVKVVVSAFVTKGEESLGNLEKGFVEDDALRCRESEISPPELKKKMLLRDLECGCVSGEIVGDFSDGTSVLGNFCHVDGMNKVGRELWARNSGKMKDGNGKMKVADDGNEGFDLRRSLKIAVIDDTALVEQVLSREFHGMVKKKIGVPSGPKNQKEIVDGEKGLDGKTACQAWRQAKSFHGSEEMLLKQENANARSQNHEAGRKLMYSIKEMEALRFVNVIEQRRFWRRVYDSLGPVAKEYVSLQSCYDKNYQHMQPGSNFGCIWQSPRREQAPVILSAMAGSGRRNHHSNIFVPPNMMKTLYSTNWSYFHVS